MLQRAVVMLLEPIDEGMFHPGSFGFRPGRNAHQAIDSLRNWLVRHRHDSIVEQAAKLKQKMQGHYAYYGRPGNYDCLSQFYRGVRRRWQQWLSRRSWTAYLTWSAFQAILTRHPLPTPHLRVSLAGPS